MSQINIKINRGSTEIANKSIKVPSNTLSDLMSSLKSAKAETNSILTEIVEKDKLTASSKQQRKEMSDEDEESDDEDNEISKKLKS
jgi:hypothetical protein